VHRVTTYLSTCRNLDRVHGICEEYRAAATIDVEHDRADKESSKRIECPMLHLWAEGGPLDLLWKRWGARHLAAMGATRERTGDEERPLLSGKES
jgi:hypothetical protein